MNAAVTGVQAGSRQKAGRPTTNPHAEWVDRDEFLKLVREYYGTKTLMFDRAFAVKGAKPWAWPRLRSMATRRDVIPCAGQCQAGRCRALM